MIVFILSNFYTMKITYIQHRVKCKWVFGIREFNYNGKIKIASGDEVAVW